jgi:hypothetical protein
MSSTEEREVIVAIAARMEEILASRPIIRLFSEHDHFRLRYGKATEINSSLDVKILYADAVNVDDKRLRELVRSADPSVEVLQSDIDTFTSKQNSLLGLLHSAADNHQWDEVYAYNSTLQWVNSELSCLRITLGAVI